MSFPQRYTGEGLVILATPTGGAELTLSNDFTSFSHSFSVDNVDATAGNEREKSKLTTKEDLSWSLDVFDGDSDTWNALLATPTGYMEVYPHGVDGSSEYIGFNYVLEKGDRATGTDKAATLTASGSRSGAMVVDFGTAQGAVRHLVFTTQPTTTVSGAKIASVVVSVENASNAVITADESTVITLSKTNDGDAVLTGVLVVRVIHGVASFPGVIATTADTGNKIHAVSDKGYTAADSSAYTVS